MERLLNHDFIKKETRYRLGYVVLAVAFLVTMLVAGNYWYVETVEQAAVNSRNAPVRATAAKRYGANAIKELDETLAKLKAPWGVLFSDLERVATADVDIVAMKPDASTSSLTLQAAGKDMAAMVNYVRALETRTNLREVKLTSHDVVQNDPMKPIRFNVVAKWPNESTKR